MSRIPFDPWWRSPSELARLWDWLVENSSQPDDPVHFIENPRRYAHERDRMLAVQDAESDAA